MRLYFSLLLYFLLCACIAASGALFFVAHHCTIDISVIERTQQGAATIVLDDEGNEWARFAVERRDPICYQQMPQVLIDAFVAAEDWRFFEHHGISWKGIARSTLINLYHRRYVQGASTITQQLVKLLFFHQKKSIKRKIKEQLYAILLEMQLSKQQIMQAYLNNVYFGCGIYGVEAAAHRFWGCAAADLSCSQAATLAGIVRSPSSLCPLINARACERRRNTVLMQMVKIGRLAQQEYERMCSESLSINGTERTASGTEHLKEMVRRQVEKQFGKNALYADGLVIKTTLNQTLQKSAYAAFYSHIRKMRAAVDHQIDGAFISIEGKSGAIQAAVGGFDFHASRINRVTQARRQLGSLFKPLVYAVALEQGKSFADTEIDEPLTFSSHGTVWQPHNHHRRFDGQMTLAYALSHSNNIVTIKTALSVGLDPIVVLAKKAHLTGQLQPYPSLALGCSENSLFQAAALLNMVAQDGVYVEPHLISWIKDKQGTKIWRQVIKPEQVVPVRIAQQLRQVLMHWIGRTEKRLKGEWGLPETMCKTGTTNDWRTCWFVGSTPDITTAVYIGRDDNKSIGERMYPVRTAFPIWLEYMKQYKHESVCFAVLPSLRRLNIDEKTGEPTRSSTGAMTILV